MDKTEMMKRYESETGKQSAIVKFMVGGQALEQKSYPKLGPYDYSMDYIAWLEAKAATYGSLMSGGRKTLKEWANFLGKPVAVDNGVTVWAYDKVPDLSGNLWVPIAGMYQLPRRLVDFSGDWKDSLTLPDGWEEK